MIPVHTDFGVFDVPYKDGMTVDQLQQAVMDQQSFEIRGGYEMRETNTGHVLNPVDPVVDGRYYYLTAFTFQRRHRTT